MNKCATAVALFFFFLSFHSSAQTILDCNFSNGMSPEFILIDADQNQPSSSMEKQGFSVGQPWIVATPATDSNPAACSTSWYSPAGISDDWMIIPGLEIADPGAVLRWRAMASDAKHPDGYQVYVAEGVAQDQYLFSDPAFSIDQENAEWTERLIDLSDYQGKTISLAFVNNSTDCSRLYIDDIYVGANCDLFIYTAMGAISPYQGDVPVKVTLNSRSQEAISSYTIGLEYNGQVFTQDANEPISAGAQIDLTLDYGLQLLQLTPMDYTLWVEANGKRHSVSESIKSYPRKVVCEDITGMWCQYCVRGIVALDEIRENYSDRIIGIAVHSGDALAVSEYVSELSQFVDISGLPAGCINRRTQCDPGKFIDNYRSVLENEEVAVAISLEAERDADTRKVNATTSLQFAQPSADIEYAIAYVLIEDRIQQPNFYQMNGYSGHEPGSMGGWEDLPEMVSGDDLFFDDTVRGAIGKFNGISGSVPSEFEADQVIEHNYSFRLPDNVYVDNNTRLVALLIDQSDFHIVNAEVVSIGEPNSIGSVANVNATEIGRFTISGLPANSDYRGIVIIRYADGTSAKVMQ